MGLIVEIGSQLRATAGLTIGRLSEIRLTEFLLDKAGLLRRNVLPQLLDLMARKLQLALQIPHLLLRLDKTLTVQIPFRTNGLE